MHRRRSTARIYVLCLMLVLGAAAAWTAHAEEPARDAPPPKKIRDLDYGDVLFHFFQDDYFESLVRLEVNTDFNRMTHHAAEAELLSGGLYLSLGLHREAERIFDRLLAGPVAPSVRDRARFYLARINYQRGYPEAALRNLGFIQQPLAGKLEPERRLLEANVLMALGKYAEAATRLEAWTDTGGWSNFARFNLGVALVRAGDFTRGRQFLEQVGMMEARNEEQASLRDRANLALGFALLQQKGGDEPAAVLSRVRLDGPFTNKALLALGWAEANANRPDRALVPWLELQQRPLLDASVQESLIAVPYAYVKLASNGQASQHYRAAVDAFNRESRRLDESIAAIEAGGFLDSILTAMPKGDRPGWFWQLEKLPDAPHTRYLYHLMASHEFQEGLKNYRDLRLMQANLARWTDSLEAFGAMIEAREIAATQREPRRQEVLAGTDLDALNARHQDLANRFAQVESTRDIAALASPQELEQWQALARIDATIAAMPAGEQREEFAERARLLRGALSWELDRNYKQRAARTRRDLQQTQAALAEVNTRLTAIGAAGDLVPRNTQQFAARVAELSERVARITPEIDATAL
ncbi:MAG: tetratricopeptide repeat protein, partial [Gammaproteobacteria bacterium]|nr:tetratricopeptide repeat protein [Gammaproteobacteria bacterium]